MTRERLASLSANTTKSGSGGYISQINARFVPSDTRRSISFRLVSSVARVEIRVDIGIGQNVRMVGKISIGRNSYRAGLTVPDGQRGSRLPLPPIAG